MMRLPYIYLAGPWARREEVREVWKKLDDYGFVVFATWLNLPHISSKAYGDAEDDCEGLAREAQRDLDEIRKADAVVVVNLQLGEGKAVETGVALALNKPVVILGKRTNVFQYLPQVFVTENLDEVIRHLERRADGRAA